MSLTLTATSGGNYKPHPEGIHPAVLVDVIDLGMVATPYGDKPKIRFVFESEEKTDDGKMNCTVSRSFTASLNPKANLAKFLGQWRGKPLTIGESIELESLVGKCCTLVINHQTNDEGKTFANITAISKPTKKLAPSGSYDPEAARQRIAEYAAKNGGGKPAPRAAAPAAPVRCL